MFLDDSKQEAVDCSNKKGLHGENVKEACISILNCHPENKFDIEALWFVFKSFCSQISIDFPKKIGGGDNRKAPDDFAFTLYFLNYSPDLTLICSLLRS